MLAPDNRTDDRAQNRPGGHGEHKGQPAQFAAVAAAHPDETGGYAERRPAEEAKGDAATPPSSPAACARAPADLELRAALARESHRRAVRTRRTTMVALSIASRLPGPTSRHPSGAVTRTRTPGARAGVSWAPRAPSGKPSASAKREQMRFMGHLPRREQWVGLKQVSRAATCNVVTFPV